jgi:diguanylate cyclase
MKEMGHLSTEIALDRPALGRLMPLYAVLDRSCLLCDAGPTLRKLAGEGAVGRPLDQTFVLLHPAAVTGAMDLTRTAPLRMILREGPPTPFRGTAVPLAGSGGGVLLNLSFGSTLGDAVRDHALSATDFAVTDLASELLFLSEAKDAVMAEARKFSDRLRGARAQAMEQALTDPLTGLRNRRGLDRALARLSASGQSFGLVHVDLDRFKQINDTMGHPVGDLVLAAVGSRLRRAVRDDDSVARIGGDEFVVLLPGLSDHGLLHHVAQRLLMDLLHPVMADGVAVEVSASLGVAVWDGAEPAPTDALLLAADRALYRSKDAGRGRVTFAASEDIPAP